MKEILIQILECDTQYAGAREVFKLLKGIKNPKNSRPCIERKSIREQKEPDVFLFRLSINILGVYLPLAPASLMLTLPEASGLSVYVWPVYHETQLF